MFEHPIHRAFPSRAARACGAWLRRGLLATSGLMLLVSSLAAGARAQEALPAIGASRDDTTVSGISSGAFMAVQFQVAFSGEVAGLGAVAGGPYLCAEGSVSIALGRCMQANLFFGPPDAAYLLRRASAI